MSAIEINSFNLPDEVIDKFNNTKIEAVNVGGGGNECKGSASPQDGVGQKMWPPK